MCICVLVCCYLSFRYSRLLKGGRFLDGAFVFCSIAERRREGGTREEGGRGVMEKKGR